MYLLTRAMAPHKATEADPEAPLGQNGSTEGHMASALRSSCSAGSQLWQRDNKSCKKINIFNLPQKTLGLILITWHVIDFCNC